MDEVNQHTPNDLTGKVAVVAGGASGIGRATAELMAKLGAKVYVGDFDFEDSPWSDGIEARHCDIRSEDDVRQLIGHAVSGSGGIDILVNSAGIGLVKQITDVTEAEWDAVLDTNLKGAFLTCKHAIPEMRKRGGGAIVNIASNAGILPRAHDPVYSISKHALVALTKSLALCHGQDNIRLNAICPGPVGDTRMMNKDLDAAVDRAATISALLAASPIASAQGRMISPEEVAQAALYLVSDTASMVSGTVLAIDGAKSLGVPPTSS